MSEQHWQAVAVEARESAKAAHHRLDRMNGSLDHLGKAVENVDEKADAILLKLAFADGGAGAQRSFVMSRRFLISTLVIVLTSSGLAAVVTLLLQSHR